MGDLRHAIGTFDKKFEIFHFRTFLVYIDTNLKFSILKHFHLKNRCLAHVYIDTAWATRDMQSPLLTKMTNFQFLNFYCATIYLPIKTGCYPVGSRRQIPTGVKWYFYRQVKGYHVIVWTYQRGAYILPAFPLVAILTDSFNCSHIFYNYSL